MTSPRRLLRVAATLVAGLAVLGTVACSSDKDDSSSTTTTAPSSSSSSTSTTAPAAANTITVPLKVTAGSGGGARVIVQASIGGGPVVPMLLDTGSPGVVVAAGALGPGAAPSETPASVGYLSTTFTGVVAQASVTMGPFTTAAPIAVIDAQAATCADSGNANATGSTQTPCDVVQAFGDGLQGVIGIGLNDADNPNLVDYSPLLQVAAPYNAGFTLQLPPSGSGAGSLVVGPVTAPSGAIAVPLVPASAPTYPNGAKAWAKDVLLCWTVGSAKGCGMTDLDIGTPVTVLTPSAIPGLSTANDAVGTGQAVSMTNGQGGATLWSYTTGSTVSNNVTVTSTGLGSVTMFNSGVAFFFANTVAYDVAHGQLLVWPQGNSSNTGAKV